MGWQSSLTFRIRCDRHEYLIGQFAVALAKKAGEFYTPQQTSDIPTIVTLDSQDKDGAKQRMENVMDAVWIAAAERAQAE
jgi:hypothetical protein